MDPEQTEAADLARLANVVEAVVMLAGGATGAVTSRRMTFDFDPNGDVTLSVVGTDGAAGEATVTAADIVAASDLAADAGRDSTPPQPSYPA